MFLHLELFLLLDYLRLRLHKKEERHHHHPHHQVEVASVEANRLRRRHQVEATLTAGDLKEAIHHHRHQEEVVLEDISLAEILAAA